VIENDLSTFTTVEDCNADTPVRQCDG
jgi:hypothetical protein